MVLTRVFVYGTLKPGGRYHAEYCGEHLTEAIPAIALGLLYDFPHLGYPGMTPGEGRVHGYRLTFSSVIVLQRLDWLEDYDPQGVPAQNEYCRHMKAVFSPARQPIGEAWIYLMSPMRAAAMGGVLVRDGHWPLPKPIEG